MFGTLNDAKIESDLHRPASESCTHATHSRQPTATDAPKTLVLDAKNRIRFIPQRESELQPRSLGRSPFLRECSIVEPDFVDF